MNKELLKNLEEVCCDTDNMMLLLRVFQKAAESSVNDNEQYIKSDMEDIAGALSLAVKIQDIIRDKAWYTFCELEKASE